MTDLLAFKASVIPDGARVAGFRGKEALSQLFWFRVGVITADAEIDMAAARGKRGTLEIRGATAPMQLHGMIASVALKHAWQGHALYELVLVPKVWALTLTQFSRVFVDKTVPEIVEEIFEASGLSGDDYELRLDRQYDKKLHVCQYKESRWAFVSRLMEREGIYYFFEHGDEASKLILTDHRSHHTALRSSPVRYVPLAGHEDAISDEALQVFLCEHSSLPHSLKLRDFDYLNPTLDVSASEEVSDSSRSDIAVHGDNFLTSQEGSKLAKIRAEEWLAGEVVYHGRGRVLGLRSGYRFSVEEHPIESLNREFLVTELVHQGSQAAEAPLVRDLLGLDRRDDYHVEVRAISTDVQFRPPRTTSIPRIAGFERGFVDGPADSEYAQLDDHGRYKVKLHFDLDDSELKDGQASTWIRMLQPHGGNPEGFHLPLRKKTEVLVAFLGGDPDRPVIVGAVPNAVNPSPVTSKNHSQNVIQTGGKNRIEMEDLDAKQYIDISTPPKNTFIHLGEVHGPHSHNIVEHTDGSELVAIGGTRDIEVGGNQNEHVKGDVVEKYDSNQKKTIAGKQIVKIGGMRVVDVASLDKRTIGGDELVSVTGARNDQVKAGVTEVYMTGQDTTVLGPHTVNVVGPESLTVSGPQTVATGPRTDHVSGALDVTCTGAITFSTFGGFTTNVTSDWQNLVGGNYSKLNKGASTEISMSAKASFQLSASFEANLAAKASIFVGVKVDAEASAALAFTAGVKAQFGEAIDLRKAPVKIGEGQVAVTKAATIVHKADATYTRFAPIHIIM
ncbi:MAG TPA: type VI secretion system tip protein TssI/VgrG [Polyangiaceae bacterium]|nr:type VI secretion system tip protein TssI/VgrG [Polyangiaceae bacterium]